MKTFAYSLLALIIACSSSALLHAQAPLVVHDFTSGGFNYGYETWGNLDTVQSKTTAGIEVKGSAKGGGGLFFHDAPLNLSSYAQLEIKLRQGAANTQGKLILNLQSEGKTSSLEINLQAADKEKLGSIVLDLAPVRAAKDGVDLKSITGLQIQGTFDPSTTVDFEISSITAKGALPAPVAPAAPTAPAPAAK